MRYLRVVLTLVALLLPARLVAQDGGDVAAYLALNFTTVGGLAPMVTPTISGIPLTSPSLAFRFGRLSEDGGSLNNFVGSVVLPVSTAASVTLNAGIRHQAVDGPGDSSNDLVLSVAGDMMLAQGPFGTSGAKYTFGLNGELGYGKAEGVSSIWAGSVGVPVGLVVASSGSLKVVPFLTPAFGFGTINGDNVGDDNSGSRFMLGGGVGLEQIATNISISGGFQKVFLDHGKTVFGLSVSIGGR